MPCLVIWIAYLKLYRHFFNYYFIDKKNHSLKDLSLGWNIFILEGLSDFFIIKNVLYFWIWIWNIVCTKISIILRHLVKNVLFFWILSIDVPVNEQTNWNESCSLFSGDCPSYWRIYVIRELSFDFYRWGGGEC